MIARDDCRHHGDRETEKSAGETLNSIQKSLTMILHLQSRILIGIGHNSSGIPGLRLRIRSPHLYKAV